MWFTTQHYSLYCCCCCCTVCPKQEGVIVLWFTTQLYSLSTVVVVVVALFATQEGVMVLWFTTELAVRVWSAGCRSRYQQISGRLQFIRRPLCIVGKCCVIWL